MGITYLNSFPDTAEINAIRKELYRSDGPGYYVFKDYLTKEFVDHLLQFWTREIIPENTHTKIEQFKKEETFYQGCPNYYYPNNYGHAFYNYFWNKPVDEVSYAVSMQIQFLRNFVESKNFYTDIFPLTGRSYAYRVVITKGGSDIVGAHTDWLEKNFDPSRLQATLILTKKGVDYEGTGMTLASNDKQTEWVFDGNLEVNPGDLVLWRYNNVHSVKDVSSKDDQLGFIRMIFPPERIFPKPESKILDEIPTKTLMKEMQRRVGKKMGM